MVPGSVAAQRRDDAIVKPRHPRSAEVNAITMPGHTAALRTTLNAPPTRVARQKAARCRARDLSADATERAEDETGG